MKRRLGVMALTMAAMIGAAGGVNCAWAGGQDGPQGPPPEGRGGPGGGRRGMDPDRQVKMMTKQLDLSADQQSQIKTILADRAAQMKAMREDSSLQPDDRREKMRSLMTESNSKVEGVLNDKQKAKFKKMQEQMRERMRSRNGGGDDAPPPPPPQ